MNRIVKALAWPTKFLFEVNESRRLPSKNLSFFIFLVCYFFCVSGIFYDLVNQPKSMGEKVNRKTGGKEQLVFVKAKVNILEFLYFWYYPAKLFQKLYFKNNLSKGRLNGQYIFEGLAAGTVIMIGSLSAISLHRNFSGNFKERQTVILVTLSALGVLISACLLQTFLSLKLKQYNI